jgi:hypothetical protein
VLGNAFILLAESVMGKARPFIVSGIGDECGAHGVQLDVALALEEMAIGHDDARVVPPLPERPGACALSVDVHRVPARDPLHHPGNAVRPQLCRKEVDVVRHQDVGVNLARMAASGVRQFGSISHVVGRLEEDSLPIVTAMNDVARHIAYVGAWGSGHVAS